MPRKERDRLTHLDEKGRARMVDISQKNPVRRSAIAEGRVRVSPATVQIVGEASLPKGNPFEVARLAGIQAAKETSRLIPLCHGLNLDFADVEIRVEDYGFAIRSHVRCRQATGVEMEALTAVAVAALTIHDMCKAVDDDIVIEEIRLIRKTKG